MGVDILMILSIVLFVLVSGVVYLYIHVKGEAITCKRDLEAAKRGYEELKTLHTSCINEKDALAGELEVLNQQYIALKTRYEVEHANAKEKLEILQNAKDELAKSFENLANQIFEEKSKQLNLSNKEQLQLLLKPFREQIESFAKESRQQHETHIKENHLLKNELQNLREMNANLAQEALNLTKALKGENKTQGNWGEIVLEKILEQSGLREGVEYELQASLKNDENKIYRPDVIVHLPQQRDIVIDSKVSLTAYERFMSAENEEEKNRALKEHIRSIKSHIELLSAKEYEKLEKIHTLDFVLLFMPIEGAFLLALEHDNEFFKDAYEKNILVVSPSTLLVTLRTIEHIWRTQRQEEHAQKIAKEAEAMYDKLVLFVEEMQNIGHQIDKTKDSYEKAMNRLSTGRGNVIKRAQNIVKLGIKTKKELPIKAEDDE